MSEKANILVVDDESFYLDLLLELLMPSYSVSVAKNGPQAIKRAHSGKPPMLILLDVMMPEMDGYEVCRRLKADPSTCDIPVVFLTGKSEVEDEIHGLKLGAVDYIAKPLSPPILLARVKNHLALAEQRIALESQVAERTRQIDQAKDAVAFSMGALAEERDNETGNHLKRTQHYVRVLAEELARDPAYGHRLSPKTIDLIVRAAPLHDIGKTGVPDNILLKPGKLTAEEWAVMSRHAMYGKRALEKAEKEIGSTPYLEIARQITYSHHEKWDGSGYPEGLRGDEIPLPARLMAVADVYDALISKRHYKDAMSHEEAIAIIENDRGTHFESAIIDVFLKMHDRFNSIAMRFADNNGDFN
jgi:putative two-component system response regulator